MANPLVEFLGDKIAGAVTGKSTEQRRVESDAIKEEMRKKRQLELEQRRNKMVADNNTDRYNRVNKIGKYSQPAYQAPTKPALPTMQDILKKRAGGGR